MESAEETYIHICSQSLFKYKAHTTLKLPKKYLVAVWITDTVLFHRSLSVVQHGPRVSSNLGATKVRKSAFFLHALLPQVSLLYSKSHIDSLHWSSRQVLLICIFPLKAGLAHLHSNSLGFTNYSLFTTLQLFNNQESYFYQSEKQWMQDLLPRLLRKHLSHRSMPSSNQLAKQPSPSLKLTVLSFNSIY